jgi:hypothetical protein
VIVLDHIICVTETIIWPSQNYYDYDNYQCRIAFNDDNNGYQKHITWEPLIK